jgi:UDP-N-acetylmuramoyl-L-alanyl-D-glutamate--2,6-diaminopimelate ligase
MPSILNPLNKPLTLFRRLVPNSLVNTFWHFPLALAAVIYYRYPARKLTVIGVTGTDGKTTTATIIYHLLKTAKTQVALISTVSAKFQNQDIDTGFHVTTPSPWKLQQLLRRLVNRGATHLVLEATSHGLDQHRLLGCRFRTGVLTNLTHEHLDYHQNLGKYLQAKAGLFRRTRFAILNADDSSFTQLRHIIQRRNPNCRTLAYSIDKKSDIKAINPSYNSDHTDFTLKINLHLYPLHLGNTHHSEHGKKSPANSKLNHHLSSRLQLRLNLPGSYNLSNALAAIGAVLSLQPGKNGQWSMVNGQLLSQSLSSIPPIPGRLETIPNKKGLNIIIDFAHTPNALEQVLKNINQNLKTNRLITIFGCAGLRDASKRPLMGAVSARHSDFTILTAEDPRTEDVNQIISQIAPGCLKAGAQLAVPSEPPLKKSPHSFFRIPNRQQAISFAIQKLAQKGDTILITGKGHEQSMCFGTKEVPWSDRQAVQKALEQH